MTGARESPYVGLEPFSEQDAAFFFGREQDARLIVANLRAKRLTLLYGPSGVGKSSVLRAGVVHSLRGRLAEDARRRARRADSPARPAPFAVATFSAWRDGRPLAALLEEIRQSAMAATGEDLQPWTPGTPVTATLHGWSCGVGALLVVLDQFEEYFLYNPDERLDDDDAFAGAFARILDDPTLPVHFLLALREDAWSKLDRFKGRIPDLFGNYLRLDYLDPEAARSAIERPIATYNGLVGEDQRVTIEPALVDALLREIGALSPSPDGSEAPIETPFLQLVMARLWAARGAGDSRTLGTALLGELGGAEAIVREHVTRALGDLDAASQVVAADVFRFLVTPSGSKIALRISDLAHFTERAEDDLRPVLARLSGTRDARVLRPLPPAPGEREVRYELFHDVLGEPVVRWRRQYLAERERERIAHELDAREQRRLEAARREHAARFNRLLRWSVAGLLALAAGLAVAVVLVIRERQRASSRALAASSGLALDTDPELGVVLARAAWDKDHGPAAERALRLAVAASRSLGRIAVRARQARIVPSAGGRLLAVVDGGGVRIWDAGARDWLDDIVLAPGGRPGDVRWSSDGHAVAVAGARRVAVRRAVQDARPRFLATGGRLAGVFDLSPDGRLLATASGQVAQIRRVADGRMLARRSVGAPVTAVAFNPASAGTVAVTTCDEGDVRLWRWDTGSRPILLRSGRSGTTHPPRPGSSLACNVAFSPDGRELATALRTSEIEIWSGGRGSHLATNQDIGRDIADIAWIPRSRRLAVRTDDNELFLVRDRGEDDEIPSVRLPATQTTGLGGTSAGDTIITATALAPDGRQLAVGTRGGLVAVVDTSDASIELLLRGHTRAISGVGFLRGGRLVSAALDRTTRIWDAMAGANLASGGVPSPALGAAFSPDGRLVAVGRADGDARIVDRAGGHAITVGATSAFDEDAPVRDVPPAVAASVVRFAAGGRRVVVVARDPGGPHGAVLVVDARTGARHGLLPVDADIVDAQSADGRRVLTLTQPGGVAWRDIATRASLPFRWSGGEPIVSVALSGDGRRVLAARIDGELRIFDARTRAALHEFSVGPEALQGAVYSRDGRRIATFAEGGVVRVLDASDGDEVARLRGHTDVVLTAAFSPDGRVVATGGADGTLRMWDASDGSPLSIEQLDDANVNSVAFDPRDSASVVVADNRGSVRIRRCRTCGSIGRVLELSEAARQRPLTDVERRAFFG